MLTSFPKYPLLMLIASSLSGLASPLSAEPHSGQSLSVTQSVKIIKPQDALLSVTIINDTDGVVACGTVEIEVALPLGFDLVWDEREGDERPAPVFFIVDDKSGLTLSASDMQERAIGTSVVYAVDSVTSRTNNNSVLIHPKGFMSPSSRATILFALRAE